MIRILVCGGRAFGFPNRLVPRAQWDADTARAGRERTHLFRVLTAIHKRVGIAEIIHGVARGADTLAGQWARTNHVTETRFPVDHVKDGPWPGAGYYRNMRMCRESKPELVLAFPGGKGTGHMVQIAKDRKIPTYSTRC